MSNDIVQKNTTPKKSLFRRILDVCCYKQNNNQFSIILNNEQTAYLDTQSENETLDTTSTTLANNSDELASVTSEDIKLTERYIAQITSSDEQQKTSSIKRIEAFLLSKELSEEHNIQNEEIKTSPKNIILGAEATKLKKTQAKLIGATNY